MLCYNGNSYITIIQNLVSGVSLSEPQYSQEWYVRQVLENLLNKNDLPHTVAECVCTSRSQKYTERIRFAPHCCRMVRTSLTQKFTERIRLLLAEWYIPCENKVLRSALHVAMCAAMSEIQDRLQKRKEHQQTIRLQPDRHLGHLL